MLGICVFPVAWGFTLGPTPGAGAEGQLRFMHLLLPSSETHSPVPCCGHSVLSTPGPLHVLLLLLAGPPSVLRCWVLRIHARSQLLPHWSLSIVPPPRPDPLSSQGRSGIRRDLKCSSASALCVLPPGGRSPECGDPVIVPTLTAELVHTTVWGTRESSGATPRPSPPGSAQPRAPFRMEMRS